LVLDIITVLHFYCFDDAAICS